MKKHLFCVFALLFFLCGTAQAVSIKEEKTFTEKSLNNLLGNKIAAIDMMKVADEDCNLFFFARDNKTRKLEWYYLDASTGRIIAKGSCPFRAFNEFAVSPDGKRAIASTRYPSGIYELDVKAGSWNKVYSNPPSGKPGLGVLSISPVVYIDDNTAFSLMDEWDKDHFVTDSFITLLNSGSTTPEKFVSFNELRKKSIAAVFQKAPGNWKFMVDFVRLFDDRTMAFVLKSKYPSQSKFSDYLFVMDNGKKLHLLDKNENGRIFPLDYTGNPVKVLYNRNDGKTNEVSFFTGGKREILFTGKAVAGRIMDNNLIGLSVVEGRSFSIFMSTAGAKPLKIKTFKDPYSIGFSKTGKRLILMNQNEVRVFKIIP